MEKNKEKIKIKEKPALVDIEDGRTKGLWCILHNVTVMKSKLLFFLQKVADRRDCWTSWQIRHENIQRGTSEKTGFRVEDDQMDLDLQTSMIRCHRTNALMWGNGDTQRAWKIIFSQLICCGGYQKMRLDFDLQKQNIYQLYQSLWEIKETN